MTRRAVMLGFLGAAVVCGFTYFNDAVMHQTKFIGNNMPISVYGGLLLFLLVLNPVLLFSGKQRSDVVAGLIAGLVAGLGTALATGLLAGLVAGPAAGLRSAAAAGVLVGLTSGLVAALSPRRFGGLVGALVGALAGGVVTGLVAGPTAGLFAALAAALVGGLAAGRVALSGREFAVAMMLTLAACGIPGSGLMRTFTSVRMLPHHYNRTETGWKENRMLEMAPEWMLAGASPFLQEEDVLDPYGLCSHLVRASTNGSASPARRIWALLSEEHRHTVLEAVSVSAQEACREAAVEALNDLLDRRGLYHADDFEGVTLHERAADLLERDRESLTDDQVRRLNRHLIDSSFADGTIMTLAAKQDVAVNGFVQGLSVGQEHISLADVPWGAWTRTLSFWLPLVVILWIGIVALSVVVHRQWSAHEQLPYPIATFANSLLPAPGRAMGSVFRNRLFWIGAASVLFIHLNNYAYTWDPNLVQIPTQFDFSSLRRLFPNFSRGGFWFAFWPRIYFTAVAFAFFLATDVSLSVGLGPYIWAWLVGILVGYGVSLEAGGYLSPNYRTIGVAGSYVGMLITVLYTGRYYYINVLRKACFLRPKEEVDERSAWAARVFLVCLVVFVVNLTVMGLDWQLALLYTLGAFTLVVVFARITAETGLFYIEPYWTPSVVMVGLLGPTAIGPRAMLFMILISTAFCVDPRESLMPFIVNSLKVLDLRKVVKLGRTTILCGAVLVMGLVIALTVTLYFQYDRGANIEDWWGCQGAPKLPFNRTLSVKERLEAQGSLQQADSVSGFARLKHVRTNPGMALAFGMGLGLVLAFTVARWRLPKWPLHPVMFLIWSSWPGKRFAFSFMIGWFIKAAVVKYGGESVYRKLKPLMLGLIAGDMLGGIIPTIIGVFYYVFTDGVLPKAFQVMPG